MTGVGSWAFRGYILHLPGVNAGEGACLQLRSCLDLGNNPMVAFTILIFQKIEFSNLSPAYFPLQNKPVEKSGMFRLR